MQPTTMCYSEISFCTLAVRLVWRAARNLQWEAISAVCGGEASICRRLLEIWAKNLQPPILSNRPQPSETRDQGRSPLALRNFAIFL